jgi:hypothetical protein
MIELAARQLEPFLDEVAFVGGASVSLWITDPAAPLPRTTEDVDLVAEVASRPSWARFEERLRRHGVRNDSTSSVICRWTAGEGDERVALDIMPSDPAVLGFENRWQGPGLVAAVQFRLPSGLTIRAVPPPFLLATKLEAWNGRGSGDHLASRDLEDVIRLVDGRPEIVGEVMESPRELRQYLSEQFGNLMREERFQDLVDGTVSGLRAGGAGLASSARRSRVDEVVLPRLASIAGSDRRQ